MSRDDLDLEELVRRHRGKQGHENAFKGPLIDMDLHHPPCRKFYANQAFYAWGQLGQLLLRAVQYQLMPTQARKNRFQIRPNSPNLQLQHRYPGIWKSTGKMLLNLAVRSTFRTL